MKKRPREIRNKRGGDRAEEHKRRDERQNEMRMTRQEVPKRREDEGNVTSCSCKRTWSWLEREMGGRTGTGRNGTFAVSSEMQPATPARGYRAKTAISPRKGEWERERGQEMGGESVFAVFTRKYAHTISAQSRASLGGRIIASE